jgi:hypothetical protein
MVDGGSGDVREKLQYEEDKNTNEILAPSEKSTEKSIGRGKREEEGKYSPSYPTIAPTLEQPCPHSFARPQGPGCIAVRRGPGVELRGRVGRP